MFCDIYKYSEQLAVLPYYYFTSLHSCIFGTHGAVKLLLSSLLLSLLLLLLLLSI